MTTHTRKVLQKDLKCYDILPALLFADICFPDEHSSWESHCFERKSAPSLCDEKIESYFILLRFQVSLENIMETLCQVSERWITFCRVELRMSLCWWVIMGRRCTDWGTLGTVQINARAPKRVRRDRSCLFEGWASICMLCTAMLISNIETDWMSWNILRDWHSSFIYILSLCCFNFTMNLCCTNGHFFLSIVVIWSINILILNLTEL